MANATVLVDHVSDVDRVAALAVPPAEVGVTGTVRTLDADNEAVYVEHDIVQLCTRVV